MQIIDVQSDRLTIENDATERMIYTAVVPSARVTAATLYRVILIGTISSRALAPGTFAMRFAVGTLMAVIVSDTLLSAVSAAGFVATLDCWMVPGEVSTTAIISGVFIQSGADVFTTTGVRSRSATGAADLKIDNWLTATVQFDTADPGNVVSRTVATLTVLNG